MRYQISVYLVKQELYIPKTTVFLLSIFSQCAEEDLRSLMFGDYMNPEAEPEERVYQEVTSLDEFYNVVATCLEEYNNTHKNRMNLVIFR